MSIRHLSVYACSKGHDSTVLSDPIMHHPRNIQDLRVSHANAPGKKVATLSTYYSHIIPRVPGGNKKGQTRLHDNPSVPCSHPGCDLLAKLKYVKTQWPLILLHDEPEEHPATLERLEMEDTVIIRPTKDQTPVKYQVVGRVLYKASHFTTEIGLNGKSYLYNDMEQNGRLVELRKKGKKDRSAFYREPQDGHRVIFYLLARTSNVAVRSVFWHSTTIY